MERKIPLQRIQEAINGSLITCKEYHGDSCAVDLMPAAFLRTAQTMGMVYLPIHFIPFLIFKRKKFLKEPLEQTKKLIKGFTKSVLFASTYTALLSILLCKIKVAVNDMDGTIITPVSAFIAGPALLFQNETRRQQIALFLVPRVMESIYMLLKRRNLVSPVGQAETILFGLATAIMCYFYQHCPTHIKTGYLTLIRKLVGGDI